VTSRSFRPDMVETREQWVVTRASAYGRQRAGFQRHLVLRCFAKHRMNPFRGVEAYQDQCGTSGACFHLHRGDRNIDLQPRDCQAACAPKPVELTRGMSPEVVFEYLETVIRVEWWHVAGGADGA
jgi:hypothetical protein